MNYIQQKDLESLIAKYNATDSTVIKRNLVKIIDSSEYHRNSQALADKVELSVETIYQYRKIQKKTNINFEIALRLVNALGVKIEDLMEWKGEI